MDTLYRIGAFILVASVIILSSWYPLGILIFFILWEISDSKANKTKERTTTPYKYSTYDDSYYDFELSTANQYMTAKEKQEYMKSTKWQELSRVVKLAGHCEVCNSPYNLECHHITYKNLGDEPLSSLACVCRTCHESIHQNAGTTKLEKFGRDGYYPTSLAKE